MKEKSFIFMIDKIFCIVPSAALLQPPLWSIARHRLSYYHSDCLKQTCLAGHARIHPNVTTRWTSKAYTVEHLDREKTGMWTIHNSICGETKQLCMLGRLAPDFKVAINRFWERKGSVGVLTGLLGDRNHWHDFAGARGSRFSSSILSTWEQFILFWLLSWRGAHKKLSIL